MTTIVVGASLAGIRAVQALRRRGYDAPITLLGAESHLPYDRPPLSKQFLLGDVAEDEVRLADADALAALDLQLRLGTRATGLDLSRREVLVGRERLPYETLIIATGSVPRPLPGVGERVGLHSLRTLDDARAIREAFGAEARVAVVGGGFIGAEVAWAARRLGLEVTIIDPLPALMVRGVGPAVGAALARRHHDSGVRLRLGRCVARIEGTARVERLVLDDGETLDVDLVVVGVGVDPAVDWLAGSGLDTAGGVACDSSLRAMDGVYAVGDVARFDGPGGPVRREHWTNASEHGAVVAAALTDGVRPPFSIPYVWSEQLGSRLQVWGEVSSGEPMQCLHGDLDSDEFVVGFTAGGVLTGVVAFGARREALRAQRLLPVAGAGEGARSPVGTSR